MQTLHHLRMFLGFDIILLIILTLPCAYLQQNTAIMCQACRAIVDETLYKISLEDPSRTIQKGSFRIDSNGNHGRYEVPYARSETHLGELLETVCSSMGQFGETEVNGRTTIVRTTSKSGEAVDRTGISVDSKKQKQLEAACDLLVDDFEENMIVIFRNKDVPDDIAERTICLEITDVCTEEDLQTPLPNLPVLEENKMNDEIDTEEELADTLDSDPEEDNVKSEL